MKTPKPNSKPPFRWRRWLLGLLAFLLLLLIWLSFSEHTVETSIALQASPQDVWAVLTDFPGYAQWHPSLRHARGTATEGDAVTLQFHFSGQPPRTVEATVQTALPESELRLQASWGLWRILDAEEYYVIETEGMPAGTVRLRHGVRCAGFVVPFIKERMDRQLRGGLQTVNEALQVRLQPKRRR